ncbi:MAG: exodeoxyribonuclease V subunit gamma, partial [Mycobacterium sp.]
LRELQRALPDDIQADEYLSSTTDPDTLLGWLRSDIAANAVRPAGRSHDSADRSVQVHACHGSARQVDVLREVLLGLLDDNPTLEPRDIVVMCPDIETYAPLIVAGFGLGELAGESHPAHFLRVQLADRSLIQTNPLLGVATELLSIADSRATASGVLNLAQSAPVRARFAFTDDDLDSITTWVREANIRWSFDAAHRAPYGLEHIQHNTWQFGLDRILTGVAMSEDSRAWLDTALPLDDVGSNRVELAGRLAEFIDRLQATADRLTGAQPLTAWVDALTAGVAALTRVSADDAWQEGQLHRELTEVLRQAESHSTAPLRLSDVRALLARRLAGRPTRANFRTGNLTVCTMVPMRSVPHRVVCLVGLDDGVFPRLDHLDGDDVLARDPLTGERDIRSEDRQLLLDAVCAATETLVITYTGADEHTGKPQPPAVPLAELLDALDASTPDRVRDRVVVNHPLQPFDVKNVTPGALGVPNRPFTFDPVVRAAAEAAAGERSDPPETFGALLPLPPAGDVELAELVAFFKDPVRGFFRALDYTLPWDVDGIKDAMPVEISGLEQWAVGHRMLGDMLGGMHPDDAANAEWRRGALPPGRIGMRAACEIRDLSRTLAQAALPYRPGDPTAYDIAVDLGGGRQLTGTVSGVYGNRTVSVNYSRLAAKHILQEWLPLLALAAAHPGQPWTALCIGRGMGRHIRQRLFTPAPNPLAVLRELVAIYDAGRREPLPLPLKTSYAWAAARRTGEDPLDPARKEWAGNFGESKEPAYVKVFGVDTPLEKLLGTPRPGEEIPREGTRLGALAVRLWSPPLSAEGTL